MKKKNIIVVVVIAAIAALLLIWGLAQRRPIAKVAETGAETAEIMTEEIKETAEPEEAAAQDEEQSGAEKAENEKEQPSIEETGSRSGTAVKKAEEYLEANPAESYLLITTQSNIYTPIPLNEEGSFRITRADGSENVIHIGKNSFYMESSNCDNQNCVGQGEVTLETMNTRILYNMVLCLPHELTLEMIVPDEAKEVLTEIYQMQEEYEAFLAAQEAGETEELPGDEQDAA